MDASEIISLQVFLSKHLKPAEKAYQSLSDILNHNATQAQKQPVRESLLSLENALKKIPLQDLTITQVELLKELGVLHLMGVSGANHVRRVLTTSDYDPASAAADISIDASRLNEARAKLELASAALLAMKFVTFDETTKDESAVAIIRFKEGASIENVADLKKWSSEWFEIIRALAICANEPPESTKVVGARSGSILLYLSTTFLVTALLARIAKHMATIAKELISIELARESLAQQRLLTETIRSDLEKQRTAMLADGETKIFEEAKKLVNDISPEKEAALKKAVKKYVAFNTLGGEIEMISHFENESEDELDGLNAISTLNSEVNELRQLRNEIRLLSDERGSETRS